MCERLAHLQAMEARRAETEDAMGEGAVDDAVANAEILVKRIERAKAALENAEKWSKTLKDMKDKMKDASASGLGGKSFDPIEIKSLHCGGHGCHTYSCDTHMATNTSCD